MATSLLAFASLLLLVVLSNPDLAASVRIAGSCRASGYLPGKSGNCNRENYSDCCEDGKKYPQYRCSPPVTAETPATMTLNSFAKGGDGGGRRSATTSIIRMTKWWSRCRRGGSTG
uniref:Uncharacterized protein n=1 Tax=Ananas comosus var. bracteatus TaxID=296719 RepID=A0A6V7QC73_ANACO|nr:unnamed protein product [Ananas comosus var. bracteatus]